jgi:hypothetical protein
MKDILPGVHHRTAVRDTNGMRDSSYWVRPGQRLAQPASR